MRKLLRGEVIRALYPDGIDSKGKKKYKERHVIVKSDTKKDSDVVSIYCTTQNNGDDKNNILVLLDSPEGEEMGLTEDTYIRATTIATLPTEAIVRPVGTCPFMNEIAKIQDNDMSRR